MRVAKFLVCLALVPVVGAVGTEAPDPDPARFSEAFEIFATWDSKNATPHDAVLFIGSSSIRLWETAAAFPQTPVINRGFGGAHLSDVIHYYDRVVRPYDARAVVLYAGDNDVAAGKEPARVFDDFQKFVDKLQADKPQVTLFFLAVKPSKARWAHWPQMEAANELVRGFAAEHPGVTFVDVASVLLGNDGEPGDYYVEDGLHLNTAGYQRWRAVVEPYLR